MPRFFFHLRGDDHLFEDPDGGELTDLDAAKAEAAAAAREIAAEHLKAGKPLGARRVEICDETGRTLAVVSIPVVQIPP